MSKRRKYSKRFRFMRSHHRMTILELSIKFWVNPNIIYDLIHGAPTSLEYSKIINELHERGIPC